MPAAKAGSASQSGDSPPLPSPAAAVVDATGCAGGSTATSLPARRDCAPGRGGRATELRRTGQADAGG